MGNVNISMNSNVKGYTNDVVKETTKSFLKRLASEVDIPVPGTNSSVGISAVSSAFIGYDYYNNLQKENAGRAFMHTAATTTATAVGVDMLTTGLIYTSAGSGYLAGTATILASNPVGWSIAAGIGVGLVVGYAYDSNFLGIKTIANDFGDSLNKGLKNVGNAIDSSFKSVQKIFGW